MLEKAILFELDPGLNVATLAGAARNCGMDVVSAGSESELRRLVSRFSSQCLVVLSGSRAKEETLVVAEEIRKDDYRCPILVFATSISKDFAIKAMQAGVSDMLETFAPPTHVSQTVASLVSRHGGTETAGSGGASRHERRPLIGSGPAMDGVRRAVAKIASADSNVLITGESGTGKELVAQAIHEQSRRRDRQFVAVNCAAMPDTLLESELFGYERGAFTGATAPHEGKLQHASGGTLFLDEIGEMSLLAQAKILRAVDTRIIQRLGSNVETRVHVRLVAATNQELHKLVDENRFRRDLYYRLNVVHLTLPPLRDRLEDIPELVDHILRGFSREHGDAPRLVEADMIRRLQDYDWPGNIRELRNVLESILVFSSSRSIKAADLPAEITRKRRATASIDERSTLISALNTAHWNRNEAAHILGCSRMTLYRKMTKHRIFSADTKIDRAC